MKKKFTTFVACVAMASTLLAGCGKKAEKLDVTADELIDAAIEQLSADKYMNFDATGDIVIGIDMGMLMGGGSTGSYMDITATFNYNVEQDADTQHTDGKATMNAMGMVQDQDVKSWEQKDGDTKTVYEYNPETDEWTYTTEKIDDKQGFTKDMITDAEVSKDGDGYKLTGNVDLSTLMDAMQADGVDGIAQYGDALNDMKVKVAFTFDANKKLKGVAISADGAELNGIRLTKIEINGTFAEIGTDKQIDVPQEIVDSAIKEDDWSDDIDVDDVDIDDIDDIDIDDIDINDLIGTGDLEDASPEVLDAVAKIKTLDPTLTDDNFIYYEEDGTEGFEVEFYYPDSECECFIIYERYPEGSNISAQATYDEYAKESVYEELQATFETDNIIGEYDDEKTFYYVAEGSYPCEMFLCGEDYVISAIGTINADDVDSARGEAFVENMKKIMTLFGF